MPEGKPIPLDFPGKGIDVTREFQLQPPGTTPDALNVRSRDSIAQRNRGGSRPGYSPYIPQIIPEGAVLIQHLNFIVDPTTDALPQNFLTPEPDWVLDPRFGISVPPGGAPWQPTPNALPPQPGTIKFKQIKQLTEPVNPLLRQGTFAAAVAINDYVFVVAAYGGTAPEGTTEPNFAVSVQNGNGDNFTQIGSYVSFYFEGDEFTSAAYNRVSLWRRKVANIVDDRTVVVTLPGGFNDDWSNTTPMFALDYSGVKLTGSPVDDNNSSVGSPGAPQQTGNLTISVPGEMILGAFVFGSGVTTVSETSCTLRTSMVVASSSPPRSRSICPGGK